jgi:hypothetical protein
MNIKMQSPGMTFHGLADSYQCIRGTSTSIQPSEQKKEDGGTTLFQNTGNKVPDYTVSSQKTAILIFHILHIKE